MQRPSNIIRVLHPLLLPILSRPVSFTFILTFSCTTFSTYRLGISRPSILYRENISLCQIQPCGGGIESDKRCTLLTCLSAARSFSLRHLPRRRRERRIAAWSKGYKLNKPGFRLGDYILSSHRLTSHLSHFPGATFCPPSFVRIPATMAIYL